MKPLRSYTKVSRIRRDPGGVWFLLSAVALAAYLSFSHGAELSSDSSVTHLPHINATLWMSRALPCLATGFGINIWMIANGARGFYSHRSGRAFALAVLSLFSWQLAVAFDCMGHFDKQECISVEAIGPFDETTCP